MSTCTLFLLISLVSHDLVGTAPLSISLNFFQDLPSFTQNVHRLVNDLRYYRLCNDSLPPGTVKL